MLLQAAKNVIEAYRRPLPNDAAYWEVWARQDMIDRALDVLMTEIFKTVLRKAESGK